jgi:LmbE family N-acetylglucosaminyl deacetylase
VNFERILVAFAHPDDAEFGSGGSIAKWAQAGAEVLYVCVTDGSAGSNEPGATREELRRIRREEQLAACETLGVKDCIFLGWIDGEVEVTLELRKALTREVRRFRPDMMVAPDPTRFWDDERSYINHPDHRAVGEACMAVINPDAPTRPQFPDLLAEGFEPYEVPNLWIPTYEGEADAFVDIGETIDVKIEALRCHKSQIGDIPVEDWVRKRAHDRGAARGMEYAESFRSFDFSRSREDREEEE